MLEYFGGDCFHGNRARNCDTCQVSACTLYCHTDLAYLCTACDERIHAANSIASRHERILICTVCENVPTTTSTCNGDALSLGTNCDAEIHSANLLASSHERFPKSPLSTFFYGSSATNLNEPKVQEADEEIGEDETGSWLLLDPDNNKNQDDNDLSHRRMSDDYLELVEHTSCTKYQNNQNQPYNFQHANNGRDGVVPIQIMKANEQQQEQKNQDFYIPLEHENSKATLNRTTTSSSQNVPAFFLDNEIVLEATMSSISNPYATLPKERTDIFSSTAMMNPLQFTRMNREEKVLRYREKRKARKFEKKIRYASRKASADIRPRVRGRFARKTNVEVKENQMFSTEELGYGIVPSYNFNQEHEE